jgi:hypothetical protein
MVRTLGFLLLTLTGCAGPRLITNITGTGDQVKFVYGRVRPAENGIIQCTRAADGTLSDCKDIPIVFEDKKGGK